MNDLVSRKHVVEAIVDELDKIDHVPQWVYDKLTDRIKTLPPDGWLDIDDEIPNDDILCCTDDGERFIGVLVDREHNIFESSFGVVYQNVIGWMPLPSPYKGENNDNI